LIGIEYSVLSIARESSHYLILDTLYLILIHPAFMRRVLPLLLVSCVLLSSCGGDAAIVSLRPPKGNPEGIVLVEEFADFECPYCAPTHTGVVAPLIEAYGDVIRYEWKHFPLRTIHRYAMDASEASECAADQGKFWEFVDIAFAHQEDLSYEALLSWAETIGLDVSRFERCWKSHEKRQVVLADYEEGRKREVNGTPTFFVNGQPVPNGFDTLSAAIEEILKEYKMRL